MHIPSLIEHKRDGGVLSADDIRFVIDAFTRGDMPEYQMSALAMAIYFRGMSPEETAALTEAMLHSGTMLLWNDHDPMRVDKHSTGGIGDKTSLILAPLLACDNVWVPMISGRGLGITGGTLDKLESIPGFRTQLNEVEIHNVIDRIGCVMVGQTAGICPADKKLYALRDVTGTVESIPLISSSIMSKKIAEGTEALVLDVKVGRGAFIKTLERARELATTMVDLGTSHGVATVAQLTAMNQPLGVAVGNALEVIESVDVLRGAGPEDVRELTLSLARTMLELVDIHVDPASKLDDGTAYEVYCAMIAAQGGDPSAELRPAAHHHVVTAAHDGIVQSVDALGVGIAAWRLGAGRARKEDPVSAGAGVKCLVREGDYVVAHQPLFELFADDVEHLERGMATIENAVSLGDHPAPAESILIERITA